MNRWINRFKTSRLSLHPWWLLTSISFIFLVWLTTTKMTKHLYIMEQKWHIWQIVIHTEKNSCVFPGQRRKTVEWQGWLPWFVRLSFSWVCGPGNTKVNQANTPPWNQAQGTRVSLTGKVWLPRPSKYSHQCDPKQCIYFPKGEIVSIITRFFKSMTLIFKDLFLPLLLFIWFQFCYTLIEFLKETD